LRHRELVPAEPRHEVDLANAGAKPVGDGTQQAIADGVTERVVDILEMVKLYHHRSGPVLS
jgi:hypothetical protein